MAENTQNNNVIPAVDLTPPTTDGLQNPETDTSLQDMISAAFASLGGFEQQASGAQGAEFQSFLGLQDLQNQLGGESAFTQQQLQETGATGFQEQIQALQQQLRTQAQSLQEGLVDQEGKAIAKTFITGRQAEMRKQSALEMGQTTLALHASQGSFAQAQSLANQIVSAKFDPIRNQIEVEKNNLAFLERFADKAQTRFIQAETRARDLQLKQVDQQMAEAKSINALGIKIAPFAPQGVVDAVLKATSYVDAINIGGKYTVDPLDSILKNLSVEEKKANIDKIKADIAGGAKLENPFAVGSQKHLITKMLNSSGAKVNLSQGERESLSQAFTVVDQLDALESSISGLSTGPGSGRYNKFIEKLGQNPEAGLVNAQLQALVPQLARGIYGEVGVLTDNDIKNYIRTLPNLNSIEEQNDLLLAMTLKNVQASVKNKLSGAVNSNLDVSGWTQDYQLLNEQIHEIEDRIGVSANVVNDYAVQNPGTAPAIRELIAANLSYREIITLLGIE